VEVKALSMAMVMAIIMAINMGTKDMVMGMGMGMGTKDMVTATGMSMFRDTNIGTIIITGMAAGGGITAGILGATSVGFGRQGDGSGLVIEAAEP
jgi:hypothetical protein